ncbi:unnamed protein product, partial [Vitis vinifera]
MVTFSIFCRIRCAASTGSPTGAAAPKPAALARQSRILGFVRLVMAAPARLFYWFILSGLWCSDSPSCSACSRVSSPCSSALFILVWILIE